MHRFKKWINEWIGPAFLYSSQSRSRTRGPVFSGKFEIQALLSTRSSWFKSQSSMKCSGIWCSEHDNNFGFSLFFRWDQKCTVLLHTVSQSVDVISSHLWSGPWCIGMTTVCTHTHPSHLNIRWHGHFLTPFSQLWFHFLSLYSLCKGVDLEFSDLWKHFLSFHRRSKRPCSINQEISCTRLAFRNSSLIIKWAIPLHDPRSEQVHSSMMRWMCCKIRLSCRLLTSRWQQAGAFLEAKRHINA